MITAIYTALAVVFDSHVHTCDLREPYCARFPVWRKIALSSVVAVPYIVNDDLVAIDLGPSCPGNISLPGTIVAQL